MSTNSSLATTINSDRSAFAAEIAFGVAGVVFTAVGLFIDFIQLQLDRRARLAHQARALPDVFQLPPYPPTAIRQVAFVAAQTAVEVVGVARSATAPNLLAIASGANLRRTASAVAF
ncbi:hypothetical protein B0A50_01921 [Salinomyces thailandicus]|uniref:Uncharacterized protein n=1 Tax=Salinomyces thailandicus TaxID=706561 RepID=A0A4U0U6X1_9PEZI|nr:hypothetical protein B0A50_01921 [Salinomyces thailandica]